MPSARTLRWGLLSTARVLRRFVPALAASSRSALWAIASREPERARQAAARLGAPRAHGSYEALLADPEIDAVYLPLPNHLHAEWAVRAARAGKHVLCEKPLALSLADVDAMAEAARAQGVHLCEAFVHLHHPQARALRATLASGALGRLLLARGAFAFRVTDPANIRLDPARGGGALWDVGCYPVSLIVALAGEPPIEASAFGEPPPGVAGAVDRALVGQLRFASGLLAQVDCGFVTPLREALELWGERGALSVPSPFRAGIDGTPAGFVVQLEGAAPSPVAIAPCDPFGAELAAFEATVLDGAPPLVPLALSRTVAATLVALYASARTGRAVPLDP